MKKSVFILFIFFTYFLGYSQHEDSLIKVDEQLYMITVNGGNISVLVTEDGVLVVDAGALEMDGKRVEELVKSITDKEIKYLILTHYHYDHTFGTCGLSEDIVIIGHDNIVKNIKTFGEQYLDDYRNKDLAPKVKFLKSKVDSLKPINDLDWKEYEDRYLSHSRQLTNLDSTFIIYPDITFQDKMTIFLGQDTINLIYPNNAHTDCNILVEFQSHKTLVTGDIFFNHCLPYIDYKTNSDTKNWIGIIEKYSAMPFQYVIPGHGKLANTEDMAFQGVYLSDLRKEIEGKINENKNLEAILQEVKMTKYADWDFQFMLLGEVEAVYNELTKGANK